MARFLARAARQSSLRGLRDLQEYTAGQQELPVRLTSLADMGPWAQNWARVVPLQLYSYLAPGVTNVDTVAQFAEDVHGTQGLLG
jgi:hypothetical protein